MDLPRCPEMSMHPFTLQNNALIVAVLSLAVGVSVITAVAASANIALALLPANVLLIAALFLFSSGLLRALVLLASAITFIVVEVWFAQPFVCALAFAFANCVEVAVAWHLIQRNAETAAVDQRPSVRRQGLLAVIEGPSGPVSWPSLARRIETAARTRDDGIALLFVDLDNFKYVNDTLGYGAGDIVLQNIADRLRGCVGENDVVARLGGDEFAILLTDGPQPAGAEAVARRISEAVGLPIAVNGRDLRVGASTGIATWRFGVDGADELLRRADIALNCVKARGRGSFKVFDGEMDKRSRQRQEIEQDLRRALAEEAFEVHYQPIVGLATNEVISFEALIRWRHASRGAVPPNEFIPIAEELGLILPIGDWVLGRACREAAKWPDHVKVSVNFSRAQFEAPNARSRLETALAESGLSANRLQLEITETTVVADPDRANMLLDEFRELGIEIAMDDFGTGYSSLGCLRNCPFDRLKIDRAFIRDLTTSSNARAILTMIVKLAATLGIRTTAEGIETPEQYEIVKEEGCEAMQGFFFSPAKSAEDVLVYFQSGAGNAGTAA